MTDWSRYRKCPVCAAEIGEACLALSGIGPDGEVREEAGRPHGSRKQRAVSRG